MPTFSSFDDENKQNTGAQVVDFTDKQAKGTFLTKVFGMMFLCLLITTAVAAGLGYGFMYLLVKTATDGVYNLSYQLCLQEANAI